MKCFSFSPFQYIEEHLKNKRQRESLNPFKQSLNPCYWCDWDSTEVSTKLVVEKLTVWVFLIPTKCHSAYILPSKQKIFQNSTNIYTKSVTVLLFHGSIFVVILLYYDIILRVYDWNIHINLVTQKINEFRFTSPDQMRRDLVWFPLLLRNWMDYISNKISSFYQDRRQRGLPSFQGQKQRDLHALSCFLVKHSEIFWRDPLGYHQAEHHCNEI